MTFRDRAESLILLPIFFTQLGCVEFTEEAAAFAAGAEAHLTDALAVCAGPTLTQSPQGAAAAWRGVVLTLIQMSKFYRAILLSNKLCIWHACLDNFLPTSRN